jgi:hypothetical protein
MKQAESCVSNRIFKRQLENPITCKDCRIPKIRLKIPEITKYSESKKSVDAPILLPVILESLRLSQRF